MTARFLAVAGNIGAGKSTLVRFLSRRFGLEPLYEPVDDNPYLDDFYEDMSRWAFASQVFYLSRKFQLHVHAQEASERVVLDRSIYEDAEIFVEILRQQGRIDARDHATYLSLYESIRQQVQPPDMVIYLRCSVKGLRRRIRKRGRASELDIPTTYIKRLNEAYERWFENYDLGPKAAIETERLDYLSDLIDRVDLFEQIRALLGDPPDEPPRAANGTAAHEALSTTPVR